MTPTTQCFQDEIDAIAAESQFARELDSGRSPFTSEVSLHIGEGGATTAFYQDAKLVGVAHRIRDSLNRTQLVCVDLRPSDYEPNGADLHVRMALSCLDELEAGAMSRKRRIVRNFNEHAERESQLSAARVSLDRALDHLVPKP